MECDMNLFLMLIVGIVGWRIYKSELTSDD